MKRILSLFLVLCLFLPALSFAELDEEDLSFEDVSLDEEWGSFVSKCVVEGGQISVEQELTLKRCREDKSRYDGYRDFARKVSKAYDGKLVLKK